jgi:hypothetical protein
LERESESGVGVHKDSSCNRKEEESGLWVDSEKSNDDWILGIQSTSQRERDRKACSLFAASIVKGKI